MKEKDIKENIETVEKEDKPYQVAIEEARNNLFKSYKKSRTISNIIMFATVAAIAGIMFMIISNIQVLRIIGFVLAGVLVAGMLVYYLVSRNIFPSKTKEYMELVSSSLRERLFTDSNFADITCNPEERLQIADLAGDNVYKEASGINSRGIVRGTYKGHHFTYGEVALLRPSTRKQQVPPLFVGRYFTVPNDMKFDGRFIFVSRNEKEPLDAPNDIDDLVVLEEKPDFVVYGLEGADYHKLFKSDFINALRKIKIEKHLLNITLVVWGGHSAIYLSYDDAIMSFPFDKPFDYEGFEQSAEDFSAAVKLLVGE